MTLVQLFSRSALLPIAAIALSTTACFSLGAPPAEDVVGEGLKSAEGTLRVDGSRVPLLRAGEECSRDDVLVKIDDEGEQWECLPRETASGATYTAGAGMIVDNNAETIAVKFGTQLDDVARGDDVAAIDQRLIQIENTVSVDGVGTLTVDSAEVEDVVAGSITFSGQKLCVYDGGAIVVGADWTQARCIELVQAIGAQNPKFACLQKDDFDIGDDATGDGGPPSPPNDEDDCGWCAPNLCP